MGDNQQNNPHKRQGNIQNNNPFPLDVFPFVIQKIIKDCNQSLNFPIDYLGSAMLYTASVAIGNTFKIQVKKGYVQSATIFMALVGDPGVNKSHPISFAMTPIDKEDKEFQREFKEALRKYKEEKFENDKLPKKDRSIITPPILKQLIVSDITQEALIEVMYLNDRGIGLYVDELVGWLENFNKYNKGNDEAFWLTVFNNKLIVVNRKTSEGYYVPLPFISVIGTIQPEVLQRLFKNKADNGFVDRVLFAYPDGLEKMPFSEHEIDAESLATWHKIINNILRRPPNRLEEDYSIVPDILTFEPHAKKEFYRWQKELTTRSNEATQNYVKGILSKAEMYCARLALILEVLNCASDSQNPKHITLKSVEGAIKLIEYYIKNAAKVSKLIRNIDPLDNLSSNYKKAFETLPTNFNTRECVDACKEAGISERSAKEFLKNSELFEKTRHGQYRKRL